MFHMAIVLLNDTRGSDLSSRPRGGGADTDPHDGRLVVALDLSVGRVVTRRRLAGCRRRRRRRLGLTSLLLDERRHRLRLQSVQHMRNTAH